MNVQMAKKKYKIKVLKPEMLPQYGFKEYQHPHYYEYKTELGRVFWCDMEKVQRYTRYKAAHNIGYIVAQYPNPSFSVEIAYLFARLLNDGIIEFEIETKEDRDKAKIAKLERQIEELKKGLKA